MVELKSLTFEQRGSVRENTVQNFDENVNKSENVTRTNPL